MQLEGMVSQLKKSVSSFNTTLTVGFKKINHSDKMFFHYLLTILYFNGQENLVSLTFPSCCMSTVARHSIYYCKLIQLYRAIPFYIRPPPNHWFPKWGRNRSRIQEGESNTKPFPKGYLRDPRGCLLETGFWRGIIFFFWGVLQA